MKEDLTGIFFVDFSKKLESKYGKNSVVKNYHIYLIQINSKSNLNRKKRFYAKMLRNHSIAAKSFLKKSPGFNVNLYSGKFHMHRHIIYLVRYERGTGNTYIPVHKNNLSLTDLIKKINHATR